jgi:hypothetical protein
MVRPLNDEVDLVVPVACAEMEDGRLRRLGICSETQCHQRLEQRTEQRPAARNRALAEGVVQQASDIGTEQASYR